MHEQKEIFNKIDKSILNLSYKKIIVNGKGHKFEEAIANAFEKLKIISYNLTKNMLIQMNTNDVVLKKFSKKEKTIKIPGKKEIYEIELEITLEIKSIKI